jgi:hypothetical protein
MKTSHLAPPQVAWKRYGHWAAHAHIDGKQVCNTPHGSFMGGARGKELAEVELGPHGVPFGRVCGICLRALKRRTL